MTRDKDGSSQAMPMAKPNSQRRTILKPEDQDLIVELLDCPPKQNAELAKLLEDSSGKDRPKSN